MTDFTKNDTSPHGIEFPPRASATLLYIPYILLYSPSIPKNPNDPDSEMVPDDEYNVSGICITLILMALLVDRRDRESLDADADGQQANTCFGFIKIKGKRHVLGETIWF